MDFLNHSFQIGAYRPIYLWAGPGTIRMNRLKFMDYPVDEAVHRDAHTLPIAKRVVDEIYANWVHLTYDWGFPPEVEVEDWEDFRKAAKAYHAAGTPVFAYIQVSNCVFDGSFTEKDWYARNAKGNKIYYYSGRYMVDWTHPEWIQHLKERIKGALERGADGIFFDNLWYGEQPYQLMGAWLGGAGCYCERCQKLYQTETGRRIPEKILPDRDEVADYLRWRAGRVTATLRELADTVHTLKPDAPISANDYDVTMRNSYLIYGLDVASLAEIQDVVMVENFALPRWNTQPKPYLANNALTIRNTREFIRDKAPLNVLSYDVGIGFDPVYPPRRHQQAIAEAVACGASMTIKGTEYNDGRRMTLLTDPAYRPQQEAIGVYHRWLWAHREMYLTRVNRAEVALLHPGDALWRDWMVLSPLYFGAGQVLTMAGIPWRVLRLGDSMKGIKALLTFTPTQKNLDTLGEGPSVIHVPGLPGWKPKKRSCAARGGLWHDLVESLGLFLVRSYHSSKIFRQVMDKMNMAKIVLQTGLFNLPGQKMTVELIRVLPPGIYPCVESGEPVLIETWEGKDHRQVHLMNYGSEAQEITVKFGAPVKAKLISPDRPDELTLEGDRLCFTLDIYAILLLE